MERKILKEGATGWRKSWRKRRGFHHEQDARDTGSWRDEGLKRGKIGGEFLG